MAHRQLVVKNSEEEQATEIWFLKYIYTQVSRQCMRECMYVDKHAYVELAYVHKHTYIHTITHRCSHRHIYSCSYKEACFSYIRVYVIK
jgi:hypothetical protein